MSDDLDKISIDIHMDSVAEVLGFAEAMEDPCYYAVMDRFLRIADNRKFKLSIFVIGRELEDPRKFTRVGEWHDMGHEIGNHSYGHHVDLSQFDELACHDEVHRAHQLIEAASGVTPVGFISPGWGGSKSLWTVLSKLNYSYDTSVFPSWLMLPQYAFWVTQFFGNPRHRQFLRRGFDVHRNLFASRQPFAFKGDGPKHLHVLPIPTTSYRVACWHSLAFYMNWNVYERLLRSALRSTRIFHYVMHVGDMFCTDDLDDPHFSRSMPRADRPVQEKIDMFNRVLDIFESEGKQITTTKNLVAEAFSEAKP